MLWKHHHQIIVVVVDWIATTTIIIIIIVINYGYNTVKQDQKKTTCFLIFFMHTHTNQLWSSTPEKKTPPIVKKYSLSLYLWLSRFPRTYKWWRLVYVKNHLISTNFPYQNKIQSNPPTDRPTNQPTERPNVKHRSMTGNHYDDDVHERV